MDVNDLLGRVDESFRRNQGPEAERLLQEGIRQAIVEENDSALLSLLNELIGYYRETSQTESSYRLADQAKELMEKMGIKGSLPYATTLLNIANAYRAGGRLIDSGDCYQEVLSIYEKCLEPEDMLFAGLLNNYSLLCQEMGEFASARRWLEQALAIVVKKPEAYFETAVTYANLAATCLKLDQDEEAAEDFNKAIHIFEEHGIRDAHYSAALSALGTYYYKKEGFEEAAECFRKAMVCMYDSLGENEYYSRLKENLEACEMALGSRKAAMKEEKAGREGNLDVKEAEEMDTGKGLGESTEEKNSGKGLELCRAYYEACGRPMIREQFGEYEGKIAVGLVGEGSDCFGFDDEFSRDHDWGPGFCMWVTEETYEKIGEKLQSMYEQLPARFREYTRKSSKQGKGRMGVHTIGGFYRNLLGAAAWEEIDWRQVSDASLAAAVNGEVFRDEEGIFTVMREKLRQGYPRSIRYLKLAESAVRFSQAGQYNYGRMLARGDQVAARIMLGDCMREALKLCYYIEGTYPPHDKWLLGGIAEWEEYHSIIEILRKLAVISVPLQNPAEPDKAGAGEEGLIEQLGRLLSQKMYVENIISDTDSYLGNHGEELVWKASHGEKSVEELAEEAAWLEYEAFDKVRNTGGRASCQDDWHTFSIMRKSQYLTWNQTMLLQYLYDFHQEYALGHNLIEEKYGRMMASTAPEEYNKIKENFPVLGEEKKAIIESIVALQVGWMEEFEQRYPGLAGDARSIHTYEDSLHNTSYETYLRGEISTYSDKMLELYGRYVVAYAQEGKNLTFAIMGNSVRMYGYKGLEDAEWKKS